MKPLSDRASGVICAWYNFFWLGGEEWDTTSAGPREAGMLIPIVNGEGVLVDTATTSGYVKVTLQLNAEPPLHDLAQWEDVIRSSIHVNTAQIFAMPVAGGGDMIELKLPTAGLYGFQIAGKNRTPADSLDSVDPAERYVIDVWPAAELTTPEVLKMTSKHGIERLEERIES